MAARIVTAGRVEPGARAEIAARTDVAPSGCWADNQTIPRLAPGMRGGVDDFPQPVARC
jgi:hypothetical protein